MIERVVDSVWSCSQDEPDAILKSRHSHNCWVAFAIRKTDLVLQTTSAGMLRRFAVEIVVNARVGGVAAAWERNSIRLETGACMRTPDRIRTGRRAYPANPPLGA